MIYDIPKVYNCLKRFKNKYVKNNRNNAASRLLIGIFFIFLSCNVHIHAQMVKATDPNGDIDGDGVLNMNDMDNDNDGILDCLENGSSSKMNDLFALNSDAVQLYDDPTGNAASLPYQIQLTPDIQGKRRQLWSWGKIDFSSSFIITYQAYLGMNDASGADGITAVFQNDPATTSASGNPGGGLGSLGIQNGIALELDTFYNYSNNDLANDHGGIWQTISGSLIGSMSAPVSGGMGDFGNIEDNKWHNVVIRWDLATLTLSYTVQLGDNSIVTGGTFTFQSLNDLKNNYFGGTLQVHYGYTGSTGSNSNDQRIKFVDLCTDFPGLLDTDGDGTPDYLDLDSDDDHCPDSIEGSDNVLPTQILANGKINTASTGGVDSFGVPQLVNPSHLADADNAQGQGAGQSKIAATTSGCVCSKPNVTAGGIALDTKVGISSLGRAGNPSDWPKVRKGAWLALESKTKGFVINRINTTAEVDALPNPQQGMLVYDIEADCLKMYVYKDVNDPSKGGFWKCLSNAACPDGLI